MISTGVSDISVHLINPIANLVNCNRDFQVQVSKHKLEHDSVKDQEKVHVQAEKNHYHVLNVRVRYLEHYRHCDHYLA